MSAADRLRDVDRRRLLAAVFVVVVLVTLAVLLVVELTDSGPGGSAAPPPAVTEEPDEPVVVPSEAETPSASEAPVVSEPPPTESPTGDLEPGTTAIFRGEPATGPWQGIGSVREITAPGAGPAATFSYDGSWAAHDLPDSLWDELVARVSLQAVALGPPLERPVLDAAAGAEVFNAGGGLRWTNEDTLGRGLLVGFDAIYDADGVARWSRWGFLLHPETYEVLVEFPRVEVAEDEVDGVVEATDRIGDMAWEAVLDQPVLEDR